MEQKLTGAKKRKQEINSLKRKPESFKIRKKNVRPT